MLDSIRSVIVYGAATMAGACMGMCIVTAIDMLIMKIIAMAKRRFVHYE